MDDQQVYPTSVALIFLSPNLIFAVLPLCSAIASFYLQLVLEFSLCGGSCAGLPLFCLISVCLFGSIGTLST